MVDFFVWCYCLFFSYDHSETLLLLKRKKTQKDGHLELKFL